MTVQVERLVGRVWAIVRALHLTLREREALGAFEQRRDRISRSCPRIHWLPGENGPYWGSLEAEQEPAWS